MQEQSQREPSPDSREQPSDVPAEVAWLDEQERRTWLGLLALTEALPFALDAQLRRTHGLTLFEYLVLAGLSEAEDRTRRMGELAAFSNGSMSRLSHVVARLERRGWVRRRPDPADGRSTLATLTDQGWDVVVEVAPDHVRAVRAAVFDHLTATQVRQLEVISARLTAGLGASVDVANAAAPAGGA